jgi:hypothetical protein
MSLKSAIGRAVEWRLFSMLIDFVAACVVSWYSGKTLISFTGFGVLGLIRLGANMLWLKYRGGVRK